MSTQAVTKQAINPANTTEERTMFRVLAAVSFCHVLNDMMQSLLPSIYPILKTSFHLNFTQIGFITLTFQITASKQHVSNFLEADGKVTLSLGIVGISGELKGNVVAGGMSPKRAVQISALE